MTSIMYIRAVKCSRGNLIDVYLVILVISG